MTAKKDEPGKETAGAAGGGRPHAMLDLKATVVPPAKEATAADKAQAGASDEASAKSSGAQPEEDDDAKTAASAKPTAPAVKSGRGGFFTHLAAGVAGGVIALLAADMLASQLGLSGPSDRSDASAALEQRVGALEAASKQKSQSPQLTAKIATVETKLGKLEKKAGKIDSLAQEQSKLARGLKAVEAKVGAEDASVEPRVAKLEQQLAALTAAAERDPQSGRLPQLAALTGKITDLESTLDNQLDALRKNVNQQIDTRLAAATEAGEAARSGTQRIDRELAGVKTESAQLAADLAALKAESDRASATLKTTADTLGKLRSEIDARLATFAKPEDVSAAVTPLSGRLAALQADVQGVIKSETDRKTTAERIVLSLELANLKRAIDRGKDYAAELAAARRLDDGSIDLSPLARFADTGVLTLADLRQDFRSVAFKMIDAGEEPANGGIVDRLLAGAKSVVRVRKVSHDAGDSSVEAAVARMETALNEDKLADVLKEAKALPQPAQDAAQDFLAKVEARSAVDRALATVETQLKASLVAPAAAGAKAQE